MSESKGKVESVSLSAVDNGFKLSWTECIEMAKKKGESYANRDYKHHELVFGEGQDKKMLKALSEKASMMRADKGGEEGDSDDEESEEG